MIAYLVFLLLTGVERIIEVVVSTRNARWAFARGGVEYGRRHFPWMIALHSGLILGAVAEVVLLDRPFIPWLGWPMLVIALLCQVGRWWIIAVLGHQWNTRVIVVPGLGRVVR
ncbi:MAG: isoprenylcysteine carboxyl methyltransferase, partial [Glaciihabitans sp.]|nr:isoprenylcysteine carboxyl methyltransferase [Glaciihabitans sp.]